MKLKASSTIESLVAMVILVVCFGVATMIYTNVLDSDGHRKKLKALIVLNKVAEQIKTENRFIDADFNMNELTINAIFTKVDHAEDLFKFSLTAFDESASIVAVRNEMIILQ
jgi:Tfp pilus assembly protein PilV